MPVNSLISWATLPVSGDCGTDLDAMLQLLLHRLRDEIGRMAKQIDSKTHCHVDKFVAIHIPNFRAGRTGGDNRIDDLLPGQAEAGNGARVCQIGAALLRHALGGGRARCESVDQLIEMCLLLLGQAVVAAGVHRFPGTGRGCRWAAAVGRRWGRRMLKLLAGHTCKRAGCDRTTAAGLTAT